jgi:hypothetical protein
MLLERCEALEPTTSFGDSGVRTMGELVDAVETLLSRSLAYGATMGQIQGTLNPARPEDVTRAVSGLVASGRLMRRTIGTAQNDYYFTADAGTRLDVAFSFLTGIREAQWQQTSD